MQLLTGDLGALALHGGRGWVQIGDAQVPRGGPFETPSRYRLHSFDLQTGELSLEADELVPYASQLVVDERGAVLLGPTLRVLRPGARSFIEIPDARPHPDMGFGVGPDMLYFGFEEHRDSAIIAVDRETHQVRRLLELPNGIDHVAGDGAHIAWAESNDCSLCIARLDDLNAAVRVDVDGRVRALAYTHGSWLVAGHSLQRVDRSGACVLADRTPFVQALAEWCGSPVGNVAAQVCPDDDDVTPGCFGRLVDGEVVPLLEFEEPEDASPMGAARAQTAISCAAGEDCLLVLVHNPDRSRSVHRCDVS